MGTRNNQRAVPPGQTERLTKVNRSLTEGRRALHHAGVTAQMNESVIDRMLNPLGAASLAVTDAQRAAVEGASGQAAAKAAGFPR
jgi:hypothetical protein